MDVVIKVSDLVTTDDPKEFDLIIIYDQNGDEIAIGGKREIVDEIVKNYPELFD